MGQTESSLAFKRSYEETVSELSSLQIQEITARFSELYAKAGGSKGHVVDREAFAAYFNLPPAVGDRLFDAFDEKQNGKISFEEFVCGLAIVLHGSFHDRCTLLFRVFNLAGDEGVSREELATMLAAILQSTDTILYTVSESGGAVLGGEGRGQAVKLMVDEAFKNCDITGTGKLLPVEFEYWLKRNPKVLDSLLQFSTQEDECTISPLIMSPSEQDMGKSPIQDVASEPEILPVIVEDNDAVTFDLAPEPSTEQESLIEEPSQPGEGVVMETQNEEAPVIIEEYPGDEDQLSCAWIPSPETQELLEMEQVSFEHLTCPALKADITMSDPIGELLDGCSPESPRRALLTVDAVSMDLQGLRRLVRAGCYHSALELTSRFLSAHGQGAGQTGHPTLHTHKTLQMWSSRLSILVYMGLYKEAWSELEDFDELDNPDLYYQFHNHTYPGRTGSMVPFSLRLVHGLVPSLAGKSQLSMDRLCSLKYTCQDMLSQVTAGRLPGNHTLSSNEQTAAVELWSTRLARVLYTLGNVLVSLADYHTAAKVYLEILPLTPNDAPHIYSGLGRLYLSLGDVSKAREYFNKVDATKENTCLTNLNNALLNVFQSRWQAVRDCLQAGLNSDPSNLPIMSNLAVSTFYMGRLKEAIDGMESLISSNPPHTLQPALFANLAAAYELESGQSHRKKLNFVPLLAKHVCQGFQLQALNISTR